MVASSLLLVRKETRVSVNFYLEDMDLDTQRIFLEYFLKSLHVLSLR